MPRLSIKNILPFAARKLGLFERLYLKPIRAAIDRPGPLKVLILCKGNICRSAYAEQRLRELMAAFGPTIQVESAGLWTRDGCPADPSAKRNALERGIDLEAHATTSATEEQIRQAGLILLMDATNHAMAKRLVPDCVDKVVLLGALDPEMPAFSSIEIEDPYGKTDDVFGSCFARIDRCLEELARVIAEPTA